MDVRLASALLILAAGSASAAAADPTILLDRFEDDLLGVPPGQPDVGSSILNGTQFVVPAPSGGRELRTICDNDGLSWEDEWYTTDSSSLAGRLSYRARVDGITNPVPDEAVRIDALHLAGTGSGLQVASLKWTSQGTLTTNGIVLDDYAVGTSYEITWSYDWTDVPDGSRTLRLSIDGNVRYTYLVGTGLTGIEAYSLGCDEGAESALSTDDIRAYRDPVFQSGFDLASPDPWSAYSPATVAGDECSIPGLLGESARSFNTLAGHTGASGDDSSCGTGDTIDRWLLYTAQCTGTATVTTCSSSTEFDTVVAVYDGCGGAEIACNDDDPDGVPAECYLSGHALKSTASFSVTAGSTYPVRVSVYDDTFPDSDSREFSIRVDCEPGS